VTKGLNGTLETTDQITLLDGERYQLTHVLGRGGMATVYRAYDRRLDVFRAVKMLLPEFAQNQSIRRRFEMEARTTAKLHHRNIVTVHDVAIDGDKFFIVMELITGGCLMDRIRDKGPLPPRLAARTMAEVLDGLEYAHQSGVIHRDLKPHNVMVTKDGRAKLADFGIAHVSDTQSDATRTGTVMGTWAYMAPEQRASARQVDARSDVYAATATLFALVTGQEPFDLFAPDAHTKLFENLEPELATIIRRGSSYLQDSRYDSALKLKEALEEIVEELPEDPPDLPPLASMELVARFERGSLSGIESKPLPLSDPIGQSIPTFVADNQPHDYATASGRFQDLDDSFLREKEEVQEATDREAEKALTDERRRRSRITNTAILLAMMLGLTAVLLVGLVVVTMSLLSTQPVADTLDKPANPIEIQGSMQGVKAKGNSESTKDTDIKGIIDPSMPTPDPSKDKSKESENIAAPAPTPAPPEPSPVGPQPIAPSPVAEPGQETEGVQEDAESTKGPPTGRLKIRCLPSCSIEIRSAVAKSQPLITAKDRFDGLVPRGLNRVRLLSADGEEKRGTVTVYKDGVGKLCWDFSTKSTCGGDAK
jgi:serine/threonine protein kinase